MMGTSDMHREYRLIQNGKPVAWAEGPDDEAQREIIHYAFAYLAKGSVRIERKEADGWLVGIVT